MRTVKVVIIGNSGVGKTSLRGQVRIINCLFVRGSLTAMKYVSGQFSTAYRSTIGTDFITKTLPHHSKPDESVTLQIWVSHHHYHYVYLLFYCHRSHNRRILPDKNAFHPFLLHFSVEQMPSS